MKKTYFLFFSFILVELGFGQTYEFKIITSVEPYHLYVMKPKIIDGSELRDYKEFTSKQSKSNKKSGKSVRRRIRLNRYEETKILDLSNSRNISGNDAVVASKLSVMSKEGWSLFNVVSGTVSLDDSDSILKGEGVFITRYIFRREL